MKTQNIEINGMTCGHCIMSVKKELNKIEGVSINSVRIGSAEIVIDEAKVSENKLREAVQEAGYSIVSIH